MLAAQVGKHHVSIALATLKSRYNSHLISYSSSAFRKIAQAGGGGEGQGELWCICLIDPISSSLNIV